MTAAAMEQEDGQEWDLYSRFMASQPAAKLSRPLPPTSETDQTPAKQPKTHSQPKGGGKGKQGNGKGKGRGKKQLTQEEQQELTDLRQLCEQLIRLALRHEDSIKALQLDTSFVLWLRVGLPGGLPESLHQSAETWRTDRDNGLARTSLRHQLWLHLWKEFQRRLTPELLTAEVQSLMTKLGYLKDGQWAFLRWEANEETGGRIVPDTEKKPMNMQEIRETVDHIVRLSQDAELITRCCPTRPLAAELRASPSHSCVRWPIARDPRTSCTRPCRHCAPMPVVRFWEWRSSRSAWLAAPWPTLWPDNFQLPSLGLSCATPCCPSSP